MIIDHRFIDFREVPGRALGVPAGSLGAPLGPRDPSRTPQGPPRDPQGLPKDTPCIQLLKVNRPMVSDYKINEAFIK